MTSDADNPRSDTLSRTNRVQRNLDPFAHCTALLKVYVWFASHSSTGLCLESGSKPIKLALRSSAFDLHDLPADS